MTHIDGTDRTVPDLAWRRAWGLVLLLVILATAAWEFNWRAYGYNSRVVDSPAFWTIQRKAATAAEDPVVVVGSSRTLFDINLDVWERLDGRRPIQLSLEGTSGLHGLKHLAEDPDFSGTVIVGVTPPLYFTGFAYRGDVFEHFESETPSEWAGKQLSMPLERVFAFIEAENLPLFELIQDIPMPNREGVNPPHMEIRKLSESDFSRNTSMWPRVEEDSTYRQGSRDIWVHTLNQMAPPPNAPPADPEPFIEETIAYVAAIRERGGDVVFIRAPSSGPWREVEAGGFPREKYWDRLMERVDARGIHFEDHPELMGLDLPEWSHLSRASAIRYTEALYPLIQEALTVHEEVAP
ncbi:MAG: hypothetical protein COV99_07645 [Bacteroidetes bacterium CG12_big_fil_rev_8_21_14_0_65_60_17]|nr:MAG: hypothetical protein COV99_07645 [Bacteroidetes bacterium CG12_big_fil_rev_8_21_14_0_65_60_17]